MEQATVPATISTRIPVHIRSWRPDDANWLKAGYLRSVWSHCWLRNGREDAKKLTKEIYMLEQERLLDSLLEHSDVRIACNPEDHWHCWGFIIASTIPSILVVHYLYLKRMYRRQDIGFALLFDLLGTGDKLVYTHYTAMWGSFSGHLERRFGIRSIYNPYLAR